jgi:hypothetical protein
MAVATAIKLGLKKGKKLLKGAKSGLKKITQAQRAGKTPTGGRGAAGRKTRRATTKKRTAAKPVKPTGSVKGAAGRRARRNQLKTAAAGAGAVIGGAAFLPKKPKQPTQPKLGTKSVQSGPKKKKKLSPAPKNVVKFSKGIVRDSKGNPVTFGKGTKAYEKMMERRKNR